MVKNYDKKSQQPPKPRPPTREEMDAMMAISLLRDMSAHAEPGTSLRVRVGVAEVSMVPKPGAFAEASPASAAAPGLALVPDELSPCGKCGAERCECPAADAPKANGPAEVAASVEKARDADTTPARTDDDELLGPVVE